MYFNKLIGVKKNLRILSILSIICPIVFIMLETITRILSNQQDIIRIPLSELAVGQYGWLGSLSFIALAITLFVFTIAISTSLPEGRFYKTILVIFFIISVCFFMAAFIKTEPNHATWSVHRVFHVIIVSVGAGLFPIGCFLVAQNIKRDKQWGSLFGFTLITGYIALFVVGSRLFVLTYWPLLGLQELLLLSGGLIWIEVISFRNLKISGSDIPPSLTGHPTDG